MLSVTIPAYNAASTLEECLVAIRQSAFQDYELIVVDDGSTDTTREIASRYADRVISSEVNKGLKMARKTALTAANGDIVVNIDSDVVLKPDNLEKISNYFSKNKDINALTGLLAKDHPHVNYFSQYKNIYMNYMFSNQPEKVSFLYGSIFSVRKDLVKYYNSEASITDDTEYGQQLVQQGEEIALLKELDVIHLKKHDFRSWLKNDFLVPFQWAIIFLKKKGWKQLGRNKTGYSHSPTEQLISVVLAPLILLLVISMKWLPIPLPLIVIGLTAWLLLNLKFFSFLTRERGIVFGLIKAIPVTFLDHLVMATGIASGFASVPFKRHRD